LSDEFLSAFDGFYVVPAWNAARSGTQKFWPQTSKNGRIDTPSHTRSSYPQVFHAKVL